MSESFDDTICAHCGDTLLVLNADHKEYGKWLFAEGSIEDQGYCSLECKCKNDPVHTDEGKWWFWTGYDDDKREGPFNHEIEARRELEEWVAFAKDLRGDYEQDHSRFMGDRYES